MRKSKSIFKELEGFFSDDKPEIPRIWEEIQEIWEDFFAGSTHFDAWEKEDALEGLMTGVSPENMDEAIFALRGFSVWKALPIEMSTMLVTVFISGIRVGNALAKRRAEEK